MLPATPQGDPLDECLLHREIIVDWAETRPRRTGLTTGPRAPRYPRRHRRTINGVLHDIDCRHCVRDHCKQDNSPQRVSSTTAGTASRIGNAAPTSGPAKADSGRKGGLPGICDQSVIATHGPLIEGAHGGDDSCERCWIHSLFAQSVPANEASQPARFNQRLDVHDCDGDPPLLKGTAHSSWTSKERPSSSPGPPRA
jgi:hypothetical protein